MPEVLKYDLRRRCAHNRRRKNVKSINTLPTYYYLATGRSIRLDWLKIPFSPGRREDKIHDLRQDIVHNKSSNLNSFNLHFYPAKLESIRHKSVSPANHDLSFPAIVFC